METFIKTPGSEPPEKHGHYITEIGELFYHPETPNIQGRWDTNEREPRYWLKKIENKAITLEDAKKQIRDKWCKIPASDPRSSLTGFSEGYTVLKEAAELYLSQNTAALMEEVETLKKAAAYATAQSIIDKDKYEQQVKTLAEAWEQGYKTANEFCGLPSEKPENPF